jgi:hypothetical protein
MDNIGDLIVWKIHLKIKEKVTKDISYSMYLKTNMNIKFIQISRFHWLTNNVIQQVRKLK